MQSFLRFPLRMLNFKQPSSILCTLITLFVIFSSGFQVMIPPRKCDAVVALVKITKTNQEIKEEAIALTDANTAAATD